MKRAALPYVAVPAATTGVSAYAVPIFQRAGITAVGVPIPEGTADITQLWIGMLEANPPPDATVGLLTGPGCITAMKAKPTTPTQKPLVLPAMCTDTDVVEDAGRSAKGTLFVRQTAATDRKNADVLDTYGWILYLNKRTGEAKRALFQALEIDRDSVAALYHVAVVLMDSKETEEARARLGRAKELAQAGSEGDKRFLPKINEALEKLAKTSH